MCLFKVEEHLRFMSGWVLLNGILRDLDFWVERLRDEIERKGKVKEAEENQDLPRK